MSFIVVVSYTGLQVAEGATDGKSIAQDTQEAGEGHKEGYRQAGIGKSRQTTQGGAGAAVPRGREANPPLRRQPSDPQGQRAAPVQTYIAAMPGWKRDIGRRLDARIVGAVPAVRKAVKWNSPFYGIEDQGWFLHFHCYTRFVRVAFVRGASLRPLPPGESKQKEVRSLDVHEDEQIDEAQFAS